MSIAIEDIVPFSQARARLTELAEEVRNGAEKIVTKNGESYVALIDARKLAYYHRLERERINLLLLEDVERGLADVEAGAALPAEQWLADRLQRRERE
ncbi:type II toxin-antitoxin system Phd/YefM family antitoxin [Chitinimonas koreensis]|uniref:type II toxin-antitoxin system Phd/YefM family antitoxin n=1 Tax=Chitinimonas koreensis TaxID=356302 RepID=UPI0003FE18C8|nr:type II toxin-antitoxin system Phd/YefM family antitoxin [Chitinimonas koreensis]QNM97818.1 type II toxin-antitoxin system Phd/YefM family antitoxin [Chitinimonas koreensis]